MPLGKVMCWVCMAFFVFVLVLLTLEDDTREALMVTPLWFVLLGAGWLFAGKNVWRIKRPPGVANKLTMSRGRLRAPFYDFPARARGNSTLFSRLMCSIRSSIISLMPLYIAFRWCRLPAAASRYG